MPRFNRKKERHISGLTKLSMGAFFFFFYGEGHFFCQWDLINQQFKKKNCIHLVLLYNNSVNGIYEF
jgi:hypothetical protein